jgi:hypothetical protein
VTYVNRWSGTLTTRFWLGVGIGINLDFRLPPRYL